MSKLSEPAPPSGRGVGGCISGLEPDGPGSTPGALTKFFQNWRFRRSLDRNFKQIEKAFTALNEEVRNGRQES